MTRIWQFHRIQGCTCCTHKNKPECEERKKLKRTLCCTWLYTVVNGCTQLYMVIRTSLYKMLKGGTALYILLKLVHPFTIVCSHKLEHPCTTLYDLVNSCTTFYSLVHPSTFLYNSFYNHANPCMTM